MRTRWEPKVGMEVIAAGFGKAVVTRLTYSGVMVQLTELGGLEVELSQDQLMPARKPYREDESPISNSATHRAAFEERSSAPDPLPPSGDMGHRRSIEALRFGLVPDRALEALTVGIEELSAWSTRRFPSAHGGQPLASAITGPFGTGKSHTMAAIRRLALRAGYVVARVEVDGRAVSLSAPVKLLHQLWATTQTGNDRSSTPLLDLYLTAIEVGQTVASNGLRGIERIQQNFEVVAAMHKVGHIDKHGLLMEALLSSSDEVVATDISRVLRLERNLAYSFVQPKPMVGTRLGRRPYDFLEVLAGHALVAQFGGFKGLIITIDEFEVEQVLTRNQYRRVEELLEVLAEYFIDKRHCKVAPVGMFLATVGDDGHEGDKAIAAMVGTSLEAHFYLKPWTIERRAELGERIHGVYCDAYGINPAFDSDLVDDVERQLSAYGDGDSGLVRTFIKRYVALLDVAYGPPTSA